MSSFFKKAVDPRHSYRDYETEFSSKNDILIPGTHNTAKFRKIKTMKFADFDLDSKRSANKVDTLQMLEGNDMDKALDEDLTQFSVFKFHGQTFQFCKVSLQFFTENNKVRRFAVWLTESHYFELLTAIIITYNCILLGLREYNSGFTNRANELYNVFEPIM